MTMESKEFIEYCDKNNILEENRAWCNELWKEAQEQAYKFNTKEEKPPYEKHVLAVIQHWYTEGKRYAILKRVNESDCEWRVTDDNSELSYFWNVIGWTLLKKLNQEIKRKD